MENNKLKSFLKTLGPGVLFASTAIGVSHLVQSTRAGADFGFALVPFVIAANLLKYPFFEFGSRYANATGESIIDGYKRIGNWMLWTYFLITIGSMFFVTAAVGAVTSGFLQNLFGLTWDPNVTTVVLFTGCALLLAIGRYAALDRLTKIVGAVLLLTTLVAFVVALVHGPVKAEEGFIAPEIWSDNGILFLIALMGWMPTAVDLSAWNSLWTVERMEETGYRPTLKETLGDFNFGYLVSAVLSICFVTLGAFMLYGTNTELPDRSDQFANAVVSLYTEYIGNWSYLLISAAAFSIMFGTCIAVFDGYARSLSKSVALIGKRGPTKNRSIYVWALLLVVIGSWIVVFFFGKKMKDLVDVATILSFLIAPIIAFVNYRLVTGKLVEKAYQPKLGLRVLSWMGFVFLGGFAVYFIYVRFF